jgi:hypothetical protein
MAFWCLVWFMVFNATFSNISVISWLSFLLVEETGVSWEIHQPATSHWQTLSHNVVSSTPHLSRIRTHNVQIDVTLTIDKLIKSFLEMKIWIYLSESNSRNYFYITVICNHLLLFFCVKCILQVQPHGR